MMIVSKYEQRNHACCYAQIGKIEDARSEISQAYIHKVGNVPVK
jgi:hypothetical protein